MPAMGSKASGKFGWKGDVRLRHGLPAWLALFNACQ
jgi:hypothetical protein